MRVQLCFWCYIDEYFMCLVDAVTVEFDLLIVEDLFIHKQILSASLRVMFSKSS